MQIISPTKEKSDKTCNKNARASVIPKIKINDAIVVTLRFSQSFYYETIFVINPLGIHKNIQLYPICVVHEDSNSRQNPYDFLQSV